jgi:hypothetical protein
MCRGEFEWRSKVACRAHMYLAPIRTVGNAFRRAIASMAGKRYPIP